MSDWDRIVREHGAVVFGVAWRILGHTEDAEDVVQDVFLEAHRLRQTRRVRRWAGLLRRMAAWRALDRLRQRRSTVAVDGLPTAAYTQGPESEAIERELAERLRDAVARLPRQEASVFCLRYFENLSYQEIATAMNASTGAVATALHRARAKLEALLVHATAGE